jgi:hypothetical protein
MSVMRLTSIFSLLVGAIAAAVLLASAFLPELAREPLTLWLLAATGSCVGFALAAMTDKAAGTAFALSFAGGTTLLLGVASVIALLADATGLYPASSTFNLWCLAVAGLLIGPLALTSANSVRAISTE